MLSSQSFMKSQTFALVAVCAAILLNIALPCGASSSTELGFILSANPMEGVQKTASPRTFEVSGFKTVFTGVIRFYQLFISTQDMPACNFRPSCSGFGMASIRRFGAVRGILLTADRLQRCNGVSTSRYQRDDRSQRFMDPIHIYQEIIQ